MRDRDLTTGTLRLDNGYGHLGSPRSCARPCHGPIKLSFDWHVLFVQGSLGSPLRYCPALILTSRASEGSSRRICRPAS